MAFNPSANTVAILTPALCPRTSANDPKRTLANGVETGHADLDCSFGTRQEISAFLTIGATVENEELSDQGKPIAAHLRCRCRAWV